MESLKEKIGNFESSHYIYAYPTNRIYEPTKKFSLDNLVLTEDIDLYLHIPFCKQKCFFCGYLTTIDEEGLKEKYVKALLKEIEIFKPKLEGKTIKTVYFGGGTPSLLEGPQFKEIMNSLLNIDPNINQNTKEITMETTAEAVEYSKFYDFRKKGVNRVNIGLQSLVDKELSLAKRKSSLKNSIEAIEILREVGVPNVCCDLIYGLEGQTLKSWEKSIGVLLDLMLETVVLYPLAVKPMTRLGNTNRRLMTNKKKYKCYDVARKSLLEAGYKQRSQVMFVIPKKGGHQQQENLFKGKSMIGFGAGARSYTKGLNYRNEFNRKNNKKAILDYILKVNSGIIPVSDMTFLDKEERMRQFLIYNLEKIDKKQFQEEYDIDFDIEFKGFKRELLELDLAEDSDKILKLTEKGLKFRDLVAYELFSERAKQAERNYWSQIFISKKNF